MEFSRKVFVTGVSGAGKTTLAKHLSASTHKLYLSYDDLYNYHLSTTAEGMIEQPVSAHHANSIEWEKWGTEQSDDQIDAHILLGMASERVYELINKEGEYVIDAVPAANAPDLLKFDEYLKKNKDCSIIVVKCKQESWLNRPNQIISQHYPEKKEKFKKMYDDFYYGFIDTWQSKWKNDMNFYFYNSDDSTFCNSKEELYDRT